MESLFEAFISKIKEMKAGDFLMLKAPTIIETTACFSILDESLHQNSKTLIVVDEEGKYFGIISPKDLVVLFTTFQTDISTVFSKVKAFTSSTARDLANQNLPIIIDADKISRVTECMTKYESTILPRAKTKNDPVEGLISINDIILAVRNIWKDTRIDSKQLVLELEREEDE
ncbi:MAG: CBS domain-containing protein [Candidatus Heimdallarchaeota archaeon]|nr:CBS domain-containing protein [Candidatus Heimdallarchaeota archaeon]